MLILRVSRRGGGDRGVFLARRQSDSIENEVAVASAAGAFGGKLVRGGKFDSQGGDLLERCGRCQRVGGVVGIVASGEHDAVLANFQRPACCGLRLRERQRLPLHRCSPSTVEPVGKRSLLLRSFFLEVGFCGGDLRRQGFLLRRLLGCGHRQLSEMDRALHHALLFDVGEEGSEAVEVARGERVELVVVAFGTAGCESQPNGAGGADTVGVIFRLILLGLRTTLARGAIEPVVGGRHLFPKAGIGEKVAREVLVGELVEGFVFVERPDDVVAVGRHTLRLIAVVAERVAIANQVEPPRGESFGVADGFQDLGNSVGNCGDVLRRRRKTGEIEAQPPGQRDRISSRTRREAFLLQSRQHKRIDRILHPVRVLHRRHLDQLQRFEGPMLLVFGSLGDPSLEEILLSGRQLLVGVWRRHQVVFVCRENPVDQGTGVRFAGDKRLHRQRFLANVETQICLPMFGVGTVAVEAVVGKDRPDVAIELHRVSRRRLGGEDKADEQAARPSKGRHHRRIRSTPLVGPI